MNRFTQTLTMAALLAAAAVPLVAQSSSAARQPGSASQRAAASLDTSADGGWPRAYVSLSGASTVLYLPQIASGPDQKHMTLYVAVSYLAKDKQTPALGALKVESDGPPIWSPIPGTDLRFAVNTNWGLFVSPEPQTYYLRVDKSWLTASAFQGPSGRRMASTLPTSFSNLPNRPSGGGFRGGGRR